jgi:tRNA A-37 threonylcarbamoyl transferase component Bud32
MIGQTISHYKTLEKLGEGGMGVVYKAEDVKLHRLVALKMLPRQALTSDADRTRFAREAEAAASLSHINVATIFEFDEFEGQAFIAMEYVEGKTLKQRIEQQPLPVKEAIEIAIAVAKGLAKAHEKGIIHRDMKSDNVMISTDGVVKVMDFGLAAAAGSTRVTKEGMTLGTVAYMSPEQARGETVDHRTDIWSLGVVLYEMLTGVRPFKSEYDQAIVYSILNEEPEPLTSLRSNVPMELEEIIAKMMAKDRSDRYQHADELAVDLGRLRKGLVSGETTRPAAVQRTMGAKKRWGPFRLIYLIIVIGVAVAIVMTVSNLFRDRLPVVMLMDSPHPERVYDPETRKNKGTNADDITDILRDLPLELHKETTSSMWHREDQVLRQNPALIVIHRSCFFDATNLADTSFVRELYQLTESKLVSFLGYISLGNPQTKFLVYSRSFQADESGRIAAAEERFPPLNGRISTMRVAGGRDSATFRNPATAAKLKTEVKGILDMK